MASSDDEGETLAESVTNYYFEDDKDEPVSFSVLPIQWDEGDNLVSTKNPIFLHGVADDGLQKIYKQVTAWKIEFSDNEPDISVLSKEKHWIKLLKPRKIFEDTIRSVLVTVQCLYIVKKNPETQGKPLWDQLRKVFSSYDAKPSENDLLDHIPLIKDAIKHDKTLSESKFLMTFLENPIKRKEVDEDERTGADDRFIVDDDEEMGAADEEESDEETDLFDSVCCICDNGGELLCCEGRCMRSFHATVDAGAESDCRTLGLSKAQVKAMHNFLCMNCQLKRHQCFACGKLGSSDKSSGAEVFSCVSATCGFFYHPNCVAKLLHPTAESEAEDLQKKIAAGESFTCPAHRCHICKERENKDIGDFQFAVCRRCPRAYHRKCLPRKIAFEDSDDEDLETRAWDDLLPNNRALIYCLRHKIDEDLGTPIRNHIIFPHDEKKSIRSVDHQSNKKKTMIKRRLVSDEDSPSEKIVLKKPKPFEKMLSDVRSSSSIRKIEKPSKMDISRKPSKDASKISSVKVDKSSLLDDNWVSSCEDRINSMLKKGSGSANSRQQESTKNEQTVKSTSQIKRQSISPLLLDAEAKRRITTLLEKNASSLTLEDIIKQHKVPSTHAYSSKAVVDKTITHGKVEGFVEAVRTALQKLEEGCSVDDAKAVCGPEIVNQILRWKNKLKVYLAPFLHGMRYTSFGRHFTKVDKLKEIVDRLHWYVEEGDTIVDFCCGSNDFSWLMKEKLERTGKKCYFKNFDVIQPKNDFSFEQRDWMTVRQKELPPGSKLIMGLNPPFGVKAALANKFIDKALEFQPKLVILIVPAETERLDKKRQPYDLVWEDQEKLSGKSFYLPGSVDVNDNQIDQWNLKPPPLYLWSRSDMTAKHKAIALKQGHASKYQKESRREEKNDAPKYQNELHSEEHYTSNTNNQKESSRQEEHHTSKHPEQPLIEENHGTQLPDVPMDISPIRDEPHVSDKITDVPERNNKVISEETPVITPRERSERSPAINDTSGQQTKSAEDHNMLSGKKRKFIASKKEKQRERARNTTEASVDRVSDREAGTRKETPTPPSLTSPSKPTDNKNVAEDRPAGLDYRAGHEAIGGAGIAEDYLDEITKRYAAGVSAFPGDPSRRLSTDAAGQEYGIRSSDSYVRNPYLSDMGQYGGDRDVRQILQRYGGQGLDSSQTNRVGSLPSSTYGIPGPGAVPGPVALPSYSSATPSTMSRYTPRLDELNHTRMGGLGPGPQYTPGSGLQYGAGPGTQYGAGPGAQYAPGSGSQYLGFAPAPPRPFPHHSSSGWLNE